MLKDDDIDEIIDIVLSYAEVEGDIHSPEVRCYDRRQALKAIREFLRDLESLKNAK
jgi:hypothetical protein